MSVLYGDSDGYDWEARLHPSAVKELPDEAAELLADLKARDELVTHQSKLIARLQARVNELENILEDLVEELQRWEWGGSEPGRCGSCDRYSYLEQDHAPDCNFVALMRRAEEALG